MPNADYPALVMFIEDNWDGGMVGFVCRNCSPKSCKVFGSWAKARKHWNKAN